MAWVLKLAHLTPDEDNGANLERAGWSGTPARSGLLGDRGGTKYLPTAILYGAIEESIGGGKTSFWNKGPIEQRLLIDLLGLSRDESAQIIWGRRCCVRGGARSVVVWLESIS